MVAIRRYFLYGLMFNSFCLMAMEVKTFAEENAINLYVQKICDQIDSKHLKIDKNVCFRRIIGSVYSFIQSSFVPIEQVTAEMEKIESYISFDADREGVFKKLVAKHWYVNYLMRALVEKKIEDLNQVKGSTIDALYSVSNESVLKKVVHNCALETFFSKSGIRGQLEDMPRDWLNDIHCIILSTGRHGIQQRFVFMSSDGQYLRATDDYNNEIVWNMQQGVEVGLSDADYGQIKWTPGDWYSRKRYCVTDTTNTYQAERYNFNHSLMILLKRPQEASYLCEKAFNNNKYHRQELVALRNSRTLQAIEGFPRDNFIKALDGHISALGKESL
jgi:hypothetical protein